MHKIYVISGHWSVRKHHVQNYTA